MIRPATENDVPTLVAMGEQFIASTEYAAHIDIVPAEMAALLTRLVTTDGATVLVAEYDGRVVGMLGLTSFDHPMSGVPVVGELFWWVMPEVRGTLGLSLLRRGESWARERGARVMQMVAPNDRVAAAYRALGYVAVETSYQRSL